MPDYNSQQLALNRRRQMAQALQQESMLPIEQPQLPGANVSWTQGAAKLAQALFGGLINRKLDKQQTALDTEREAEKNAQIAALAQGLGDPNLAPMLQGPYGKEILVDLLTGRREKASDAAALERTQAANQPAGPQPYTLSPGQVRFGPTGEQIAAVPAAAPAAATGFSLSPGQTRYDAAGNQIAVAPAAPENQRPIAATIDKVGPDGKVHIFRQNPQTGAYDIDEGLAPPKAATRDGLTDFQTNQTFLNISNKFQADPIMKVATNGATARAIADQVIANPASGTQQMKALYGFVKNLDPDSAVREGETALAKQTQSYFESFKTSITRLSQGQVISPAAAKEMAEATKELVTAWEETARNRTNQYQSQANTAGVGKQFEQYRKGFEKPAPTQTGGAPTGVPPEVWAVMTPEERKLWNK